MKSLSLYLLEMLFCSGVMTAMYRLLLVRKVSFAACRRFLVAAVLLPALLPALRIPVYPAPAVTAPLPSPVAAAEEAPVAGWPADEAVGTGEVRQDALVAVRGGAALRTDWMRPAGALLYAATTGILLVLFARRIRAIGRLRRRARRTDCGDYVLAEHPAVESPFSFMRTIYLGDGLEGRRREIVLRHEASHVLRRHSVERIVVELLRCFFWFNPFVWVAQRDLAKVQEWEADRDVLDAGYGLTEYRIEIFRQLFGYNPDIACGLNHSLTKNRFVMMTQFKRGRYAFVRLGAVVPVMAGMTMLCSFTTREAVAEEPAKIVSTVHIGADGRITMNGEPRSLQEIQDFVDEERAKLSEADRERMELRLTVDRTAAMPTVSVVGGELRLDGEAVTRDVLETRLRAVREGLSPELRGLAEVRIVGRADDRMDAVDDVKEVLCRTSWLRVRYALEGEDATVRRMLPPSGTAVKEGSVKVLAVSSSGAPAGDGMTAELRIAGRNLFRVLLDDRGQVTAAGQAVDCEALATLAAGFLRNDAGRADAAECTVEEFALPDGRVETWPVSRGFVSVQVAGRAPYGAYVGMQRALTAVFDRLRGEVAQKWFGRTMESLTEAERAVVLRAVPLKVLEEKPEA